ncbi:hypothetical protein GUJ93_ZPchr0001g32325 [Zizania palustris]|uniref:Uncharacterized protein n=1 Tax=Zizania palustris TaxID=103762 RepID=A0A8J5V2Y3_ZIZPA|nr:hypothetical protein GUJ93_ZPchr0001g32325 [Zizania palustris]
MACSFPPSSATRLHAVDAAAAMRSGRVPIAGRRLQGSPAGPRRLSVSLSVYCYCHFVAVPFSSARTQLDILEQLTSPTPDGIGLENGAPTEPRVRSRTTIRKQLLVLIGDRDGEYTLPLGKKLKEGLKSLNSLTVSQRRNIKRLALLTKVSGRNDSVFFATVGAFVLVPPFAVLAIALLTGYVQLLP